MRIVLYGANQSALYAQERQVTQKFLQESPDQTLSHFDARKETLPQLHDQLGAQSMFQTKRCFKITNFEKLKSPKQKKELLNLIEQGSTDQDLVILSIPSELTPATKKLFNQNMWKTQEFKLPKVFFQFTEAIKSKSLKQVTQLLQQSLEQKNEWELHSLLARQFRLLLATKVKAPVLAPPFALGQLASQANKFSEKQLVHSLHTLFAIEWNMKSGQARLTWGQEIDRLLVSLYHEET
jgi:DNA polymerase III delta subunit